MNVEQLHNEIQDRTAELKAKMLAEAEETRLYYKALEVEVQTPHLTKEVVEASFTKYELQMQEIDLKYQIKDLIDGSTKMQNTLKEIQLKHLDLRMKEVKQRIDQRTKAIRAIQALRK